MRIPSLHRTATDMFEVLLPLNAELLSEYRDLAEASGVELEEALRQGLRFALRSRMRREQALRPGQPRREDLPRAAPLSPLDAIPT